MNIVEKHIVPELTDSRRLSDYCCGKFSLLPSRNSVKKAIESNRILVNGSIQSTAYWVQTDDHIELLESTRGTTFGWELEVVLEDEYLAVVNKPAGMLTSGNAFRTVENALKNNLQQSSQTDGLVNPRVCHHLDFETSGFLLVAKTSSSLRRMKAAFESNDIEKHYLALVLGDVPDEGMMDSEIDGKSAKTRYKCIQRKPSKKHGSINLLEVGIDTGRRHQIRIHLASIGHPILGDQRHEGYLGMKKGLYLQLNQLKFIHPVF